VKFSGVIFDMDGTLVDSEPHWFVSDSRFVAEFGGVYDEAFRNECVGMGSRAFVQVIQQKFGLKESIDELLAHKDRHYLDVARGHVQPFPEMVKLVEALSDRGLPMAVASGSSPAIIEAVIEEAGLSRYFGRHLYSSELVLRAKPEPDIFLYTAGRLGIPPRELVVFEDSQHGVAAGKTAGMAVVGVPQVWTDKGRAALETADLLFRSGMAEFTADAVLKWMA
jgi:HAD superfamily hydrolase (TIGR01509 family)